MRLLLAAALALTAMACDKTIHEVRSGPRPTLQPPPQIAMDHAAHPAAR